MSHTILIDVTFLFYVPKQYNTVKNRVTQGAIKVQSSLKSFFFFTDIYKRKRIVDAQVYDDAR